MSISVTKNNKFNKSMNHSHSSSYPLQRATLPHSQTKTHSLQRSKKLSERINSRGGKHKDGNAKQSAVAIPAPKICTVIIASLCITLVLSLLFVPIWLRRWMPGRDLFEWESRTSRQRSHEEVHTGPSRFQWSVTSSNKFQPGCL